jgi:hypothetical protein
MLRLVFGRWNVAGLALDTQSLLFASGAVIIGTQSMLFAVLSRTYAAVRGILPVTSRTRRMSHPFILERGAILGLALGATGAVGLMVALVRWARQDFGALDLASSLRTSVPAMTLLVVGAQVLLSSFFLGLLHLDSQISSGETTDSRGDTI